MHSEVEKFSSNSTWSQIQNLVEMRHLVEMHPLNNVQLFVAFVLCSGTMGESCVADGNSRVDLLKLAT
ncbi:hypothetical protein scyTo_0002972 [Scyliorhinus torazame]|uniref:Uncharacterized protein n=1 Tax=Scyliorhinus torazame TaxID=75743 RepID=A0A401PL95_SCYTO|nr:hypothetical protein [Scyliorhinus torazame]